MAKNNNARDKDTPIGRAAREISAARSKARNTVANSTMPQKRVTRSSGLRSLVAGGVADEQIEEIVRGAKRGHGDNAKPDFESDDEDISDMATTPKKSTGRPGNTASGEGVSSDSEVALVGTNAVRKSRAHRGRQAASSDGDEAPAATKKARTRSVKGANEAGDEAASSDEGDYSDVLTREPAGQRIKGGVDKRKDRSSDKLRELERKLRNAEGQCLECSERTTQS